MGPGNPYNARMRLLRLVVVRVREAIEYPPLEVSVKTCARAGDDEEGWTGHSHGSAASARDCCSPQRAGRGQLEPPGSLFTHLRAQFQVQYSLSRSRSIRAAALKCSAQVRGERVTVARTQRGEQAGLPAPGVEASRVHAAEPARPAASDGSQGDAAGTGVAEGGGASPMQSSCPDPSADAADAVCARQ